VKNSKEAKASTDLSDPTLSKNPNDAKIDKNETSNVKEKNLSSERSSLTSKNKDKLDSSGRIQNRSLSQGSVITSVDSQTNSNHSSREVSTEISKPRGRSKATASQKSLEKSQHPQTLEEEKKIESQDIKAERISKTLNSKWLDPSSSKYRPWAQISTKGRNFVYDRWCDQHLLLNSLYGKSGHLNQTKHKARQAEYDKLHLNNSFDSNQERDIKVCTFEYDLSFS